MSQNDSDWEDIPSNDEWEDLPSAKSIVYDQQFGPPEAEPYSSLPEEANNPSAGDEMESVLNNQPELPFRKPVREFVNDVKSSANTLSRSLPQVASFGLNDEIQGALFAPVDSLYSYGQYYLGHGGDPKNLLQAYRDERNRQRALDKEGELENPTLYKDSQIVGAAALPGVGSGVVGNAIQGGLQGLGYSDSDSTLDNVIDTAKGAGIGAGFGLIGSGLSIAGKVGQAATDKAEREAVAATGATGLQARRFDPKTGRMLLDEGVVQFGSHPDTISQRAINLKDETGKNIGELVNELGLQDQHNVTLDQLTNAIDDRIKELQRVPGANYKLIRGLEKQKKLLQEHPFDLDEDFAWEQHPYSDNPEAQQPSHVSLPFNKINRAKGAFDDQINYNSSDYRSKPEYVMRDVYNQFENDIAKNLPPGADAESGQQFLKNKDTYRKIAPVAEAAERRASTLNQSPYLGLGDIASIGAIGAGEPITGVIGAAARRVAGPRVAASAAVTYDSIGSVLQKAPQLLGRYQKVLQDAAQRGAQQLAVADYVLSQKDSEYRKIKSDLMNSNGQEINADNLE